MFWNNLRRLFPSLICITQRPSKQIINPERISQLMNQISLISMVLPTRRVIGIWNPVWTHFSPCQHTRPPLAWIREQSRKHVCSLTCTSPTYSHATDIRHEENFNQSLNKVKNKLFSYLSTIRLLPHYSIRWLWNPFQHRKSRVYKTFM